MVTYLTEENTENWPKRGRATPGLVPVMLTLQSPKLFLQTPLSMAVLHQALTLCQQGQLLRLHVGLLGLQLLMPETDRG